MEIYLLRHGQAERTSSTGRDADRRLTSAGQAEVRAIARRIAMLGVNPSVVLSSPYQRAVETAQIAAEVLHCERDLLIAAALTPDSTPADVWNEIRDFADAPSVLLVSHEPLLSNVLAWFLGAPSAAPFSTAGLACLDVDVPAAAPRAVMRFQMTPADA